MDIKAQDAWKAITANFVAVVICAFLGALVASVAFVQGGSLAAVASVSAAGMLFAAPGLLVFYIFTLGYTILDPLNVSETALFFTLLVAGFLCASLLNVFSFSLLLSKSNGSAFTLAEYWRLFPLTGVITAAIYAIPNFFIRKFWGCNKMRVSNA